MARSFRRSPAAAASVAFWLSVVAQSRAMAAEWPAGSDARIECLRSAYDALARVEEWIRPGALGSLPG